MSSTTERPAANVIRTKPAQTPAAPILPVINPATGAEVGSVELPFVMRVISKAQHRHTSR